jgi:hypothetical protein
MKLFGATDEFVAVHLGHEEIAEEQVDGSGGGLLELLERVLRAEGGEDAVATGLKQEGAYGESLFVVVDADDDLLGAHAVSLLPDGAVAARRGG